MRSRHPGMSPEKIAMAVAVTIAAIAGIGAMKNVTGTSSAVAIVAVSPGTAPTNNPNTDAASITKMLYGSNTSANACAQAELMHRSLWASESPCPWLQHTPRERDPEQLVEGVMNDQRDRKGERDIVSRPHAEDGEKNSEPQTASLIFIGNAAQPEISRHQVVAPALGRGPSPLPARTSHEPRGGCALRSCHPERSEGSQYCRKILRLACARSG